MQTDRPENNGSERTRRKLIGFITVTTGQRVKKKLLVRGITETCNR